MDFHTTYFQRFKNPLWYAKIIVVKLWSFIVRPFPGIQKVLITWLQWSPACLLWIRKTNRTWKRPIECCLNLNSNEERKSSGWSCLGSSRNQSLLEVYSNVSGPSMPFTETVTWKYAHSQRYQFSSLHGMISLTKMKPFSSMIDWPFLE